jgi:hypothetical protein
MPVHDTDARPQQGEIGPDLFRAACNMGLEGLVSKRAIGLIAPAGHPIG